MTNLNNSRGYSFRAVDTTLDGTQKQLMHRTLFKPIHELQSFVRNDIYSYIFFPVFSFFFFRSTYLIDTRTNFVTNLRQLLRLEFHFFRNIV